MFKYPAPLPEPVRQDLLSLVPAAVLVRYIEGIRAFKQESHRAVEPFETRRTPERQTWLFAQGRDWAGDIVTNSATLALTNHAFCALDTAFVNSAGVAYWPVDVKLWEDFGSTMEAHGLAWGGRWKRPDSPHVQAANVPTTPNADDQKLILAGDLNALWTKYDLLRVQYYDVEGRI